MNRGKNIIAINITVRVEKVKASIIEGLDSETIGCSPIKTTQIIPLIIPFLRS
jgi:hypothetical protein